MDYLNIVKSCSSFTKVFTVFACYIHRQYIHPYFSTNGIPMQ